MLEIKNINIKFNNKECIRNGNFKAYPSSITGIIGESGTGKSSLLYIIGMLSNQQYDYYYHDELLQLNEKERALFRNEHISFITQNSLLIDTISVEKNIEFYLMQSNTKYTVNEVLEMVKLTDKKKAMPESLSGGERQRVAIACAIAKDSDIILGDEITSALDEDNKKIIMKILRECADQGKTVILVSHERDIIDKCDRVYELDHLELILKKDKEIAEVIQMQKKIKKISAIRMFELLFHSNRKLNLRRTIFSLPILFVLFISCSLVLGIQYKTDIEQYSVKNVAADKILVLSDQSGDYHDGHFGYAIRYVNHQEPFFSHDLNQIKKLDCKKQYDYYTFSYDMLTNFGYQSMSVVTKRDNKIIDKHQATSEDTLMMSDYPFFVIPVFPEEKSFSNKNGVYINANMAYYYNIQVGDTLELKLNVPYAMAKSVSETTIELSDGIQSNPYYSVECIGTSVPYHTKVVGIVESNSLYSEIYMQHDIMKKMIDEQVRKYKSGEITINEKSYEGYSTIENLKPYAKVVFADKLENVLPLQKEINNISEKVYAYNEYQSILELKEETEHLSNQSDRIAIVSIVVYVIGAIIIEMFYLKRYKSTYMMLNLIGYDKKQKNKILKIQEIWQLLVILNLAFVIYIVSYIYDRLATYNIIDYVNNYLLYFLRMFSWKHFSLLIITSISIIMIVNIGMKRYYDKQDLITWLREK